MAREGDRGPVPLAEAARQTGVKEVTLRRFITDGELSATKKGGGYLVRLPLPDQLRKAHHRAFAAADRRLAEAEPSMEYKAELDARLEALIQRAADLEGKLKEREQDLKKADELVAWLRTKVDQAMAARDRDTNSA